MSREGRTSEKSLLPQRQPAVHSEFPGASCQSCACYLGSPPRRSPQAACPHPWVSALMLPPQRAPRPRDLTGPPPLVTPPRFILLQNCSLLHLFISLLILCQPPVRIQHRDKGTSPVLSTAEPLCRLQGPTRSRCSIDFRGMNGWRKPVARALWGLTYSIGPFHF